MRYLRLFTISFLFLFTLNSVTYTQNAGQEAKNSPEISQKEEKSPVIDYEEKEKRSFLSFISSRAYADPIERDDKKAIREEWKKLLGVDIFVPYFKAKEAEEWVREKASIKIFNIKGKPKFDKNQVQYIFKVGF